NEPIRKRIVINLDAPAGSAMPEVAPRGAQIYQAQTKSRRWPKVLAILLLLAFVGVLAVGAGGFFWWRHYQTTPAYSLALIIDAAQRNDMASFDKQIDDDAITRNLMNDVNQKAAGRYGIAMSGSLQKQIDTIIPTLLPRLKNTIHEEVAKEIKAFASKSEPKPFVLVALAIPNLVTITTENDKASAKAPMPNRTIELGLQRDGDRWKVTEFKDEVLIQRVVDSVMKDLPAIGAIDLSPLLKPSRKPARR
ncbi:MAG TPA: hypothetical protein VGQ39_06520, partial [Pyrinomonadaceae bacterium]|nr:hypothetical protein [Pyrinomonadaceae bacterium]